MLKVIGQELVDKVQVVCDNCEQPDPSKRMAAKLEFFIGFDVHDGDYGETVWCGSCAEKLAALVEQSFPNVKLFQHNLFDD